MTYLQIVSNDIIISSILLDFIRDIFRVNLCNFSLGLVQRRIFEAL